MPFELGFSRNTILSSYFIKLVIPTWILIKEAKEEIENIQ